MIQNFTFGILFLKLLFRVYNSFIFVQTFQWRSSEFLFNFRFFSRKSQTPAKSNGKDHSYYNTVSLKKPHSYYEAQLTWHWKQYAPAMQSKSFLILKISTRYISVWCQKKHLHCTISWRPVTTFLKYLESKRLYISVYLCKKIFVLKTW